MQEWLAKRRALVQELSQMICAGLEAAARFNPTDFAAWTERQEEVCLQIAAHDRQQPVGWTNAQDVEEMAAELQAMNEELRQISTLLAAFIERGSESARCFQRVMAIGAPAYGPPRC